MLWTINDAAVDFGLDRATLCRRLRGLGTEIPKGKKAARPWLTTRQVMAAVVGDLEAEKIRDTAASADARELKNAQARGELIPAQIVEQTLAEFGAWWRTKELSRPALLGARCNPADPHHAAGVLDDDKDATLREGDGLLAGILARLAKGIPTEPEPEPEDDTDKTDETETETGE